jgi:hypothetical protein
MAGRDHLGDGPDGVLDGDLRVDAAETVDVDVVGAQALQAIGQEVRTATGRPSIPM